MIPRFKPWLGLAEWRAAARPGGRDDVVRFERAFAETFGAGDAIAFPYGRSALWAFFKTVGLENREIIQPAYTCAVVAHATVLSGNEPRFVDISPDGFNMNLDQVEAAISESTGAIVATHLFGYPLDVDRLDAIVTRAEARVGRRVWVVQDCAHAFGARWNGRPVTAAGNVALFGLNISKTLTSIFGGVLTTSDRHLASDLRQCRDRLFAPSGPWKSIRRAAYLAGSQIAFSRQGYWATHWVADRTPLLNRLTRAYHLDDRIRFPPDHRYRMSPIEARVGLAQIAGYEEAIERRTAQARRYDERLRGVQSLALPPIVRGATYSHYTVRVCDRDRLTQVCARNGVELGRIIDYSVPEMPAYAAWRGGGSWPRSLEASCEAVNLPLSPALTSVDIDRAADVVMQAARSGAPH